MSVSPAAGACVFETPHQTPYLFNLHVNDVGHTVVLGTTGSGKSFLLNFLVTQLLQHDPRIVVLDLGHGYRKLATISEGSYVELGLRRQNVSINPFDIDQPTPEDLHFLHVSLKVLAEGEDGYRLSHAGDHEVYEAIENLVVLETVIAAGSYSFQPAPSRRGSSAASLG